MPQRKIGNVVWLYLKSQFRELFTVLSLDYKFSMNNVTVINMESTMILLIYLHYQTTLPITAEELHCL